MAVLLPSLIAKPVTRQLQFYDLIHIRIIPLRFKIFNKVLPWRAPPCHRSMPHRTWDVSWWRSCPLSSECWPRGSSRWPGQTGTGPWGPPAGSSPTLAAESGNEKIYIIYLINHTLFSNHRSDVIWVIRQLKKSPAIQLSLQWLVQAKNKEIIKCQHCKPFVYQMHHWRLGWISNLISHFIMYVITNPCWD